MKHELTFKDHNRGFDVARALLDEGYVVMLSYEEDLLIVNYEWSENRANRNDMVFMQRDEYEEEFDNYYEDIITDVAKDFANGTLANRLAPRIAKWKDDISSI